MVKIAMLGAVVVVVAIAAFVGGTFLSSQILAPAQPVVLKDVIARMDFVIGGKYAGFYVAVDKGWYRQEGLNVVVQRGFGSVDTIKAVDAGKAELGVGDFISLASLRPEGVKVKALAAIYGDPPFALSVRHGLAVKELQEMKGLTIGRFPGGSGERVWPMILSKNNLKAEDFKIVSTREHGAALLGGKVDLADCLIASDCELREILGRRQGLVIGTVQWRKWGLTGYSNGLLTSDALIANQADLVRRLTRATMRGHLFAITNPEEALRIILKFNPEIDEEITRAQLLAINEFQKTPEALSNYIGFMDPVKVQATTEVAQVGFGKGAAPSEWWSENKFLDPSLKIPK